MPKLHAFALAGAAVLALAAPAKAALLGPSAYLSFADSPFNGASFDYFHLEDVEDDAVNTPGLSTTAVCIVGLACFVGAGLTDSVGNGGDATAGRSIFASGSITLTFDAAALGGLPTHAGLVWTDGSNPIAFEAFDQNGVSLGVLNGDHATAGFNGQTDEDRFYGAVNAGGISKLFIASAGGGLEIDHVQYGLQTAGVPEPATWGLMIAGFGLAGAALRRRRAALA